MKPSGRWCRLVGLGVSALVHVAVGAAILKEYDATSTYADDEHLVAVSLAMFDAESVFESVAADVGMDPSQKPVPQVTPEPKLPPNAESESQPELREPKPEPNPEPAFKQDQEPQPMPVPVLVQKSKLQPEGKPQSKSKSKPKFQSTSKRTEKRKPAPVQKKPLKPKNTAKRSGSRTGKATPDGTKSPSAGSDKKNRARQKNVENKYLAGLRRAIAKKRHYPTSARRSGKTGVAIIFFVLDQEGRISGARLDKSSGSRTLDKAAVETLQRLARYKPIPVALGRTKWQLRVPIRFALE